MQDPQPEFQPTPGVAEEIAPGLRRLLAPNASPMTYKGTNTYLLGSGSGIAVIDPGPDDPAHLEAILDALRPNERVERIFVTHAHLDHSPLARALAAESGAPVHAFGDAFAGQSDVMRALAADGMTGGGEGVDTAFVPDETMADGESISGESWRLTAWHTPGHFGNHLSFEWGDALFSGDLVMGWATSLISPPDGDLTQFMTSCARLLERDWQVLHPGHGAPITAPEARIRWLMTHRQDREAQILAALRERPGTAGDLAARIYTEVPPALLPAAARNVFAHLLDLTERTLIAPDGRLAPTAHFRLTHP